MNAGGNTTLTKETEAIMWYQGEEDEGRRTKRASQDCKQRILANQIASRRKEKAMSVSLAPGYMKYGTAYGTAALLVR